MTRHTLSLLAIAGTIAAEVPASPLVTGEAAEARQRPVERTWASESGSRMDTGDADGTRIAPVYGSERNRSYDAIYGNSPSTIANGWSADDPFGQRSSTLGQLMREFAIPGVERPIQQDARPGSGRGGAPTSGSSELINDVLRMARDAITDGNESATFTLAGIDFNLTLKSDRRSLTVNGEEVLPTAVNGAYDEDAWRTAALAPAAHTRALPQTIATEPVAQRAYRDTGEATITFAKIREFLLHPLVIALALVLLGLYAFLRIYSSAREHNRW